MKRPIVTQNKPSAMNRGRNFDHLCSTNLLPAAAKGSADLCAVAAISILVVALVSSA
jgi:hypothetical protein